MIRVHCRCTFFYYRITVIKGFQLYISGMNHTKIATEFVEVSEMPGMRSLRKQYALKFCLRGFTQYIQEMFYSYRRATKWQQLLYEINVEHSDPEWLYQSRSPAGDDDKSVLYSLVNGYAMAKWIAQPGSCHYLLCLQNPTIDQAPDFICIFSAV